MPHGGVLPPLSMYVAFFAFQGVRTSMYEPDAPIDVKECCGIGLSSVGRRRPRERHSV